LDRVQYRIEMFTDVFCEKTQNEIAGLLEQPILPAIAAIGFGVVEVLGAIQFDGDAGLGAQ
jgi:hypothetical protein